MVRARINILPRGRTGGGLVPALIAVMVYLAALFGAAGLSVFNITETWTEDLSRNMTVQIVERNAANRDQQAEAVLTLLRQTPGVVEAERLDNDELVTLLEPWLGEGNVSDTLPLPAMISVTISDRVSIDTEALAAAIRRVAPDASLDDHQQWMGRLVSLAGAIEIATAFAVLLITLAAIAIIIFATGARLAAHRETIEIVHLIGAEDRIIAREFSRHFAMLGFKGGIIGLVVGGLTLWSIQSLALDLGNGFIPTPHLTSLQLGFIIALPILTSALSFLTAHITVRRMLARIL